MSLGYERGGAGGGGDQEGGEEAREERSMEPHNGKRGPRCTLCAYQQYANRGRPCETCARTVCSTHYSKKVTYICSKCSGTEVPYEKDPSRRKKGKALMGKAKVSLIGLSLIFSVPQIQLFQFFRFVLFSRHPERIQKVPGRLQ
jgi:hypothetical protein